MAFKLFDRIKETSTTTGTGNVTVSGAIAGFKTFASRYAAGEALYYSIEAVDGSVVPTGEWEVGLGKYSAANTLTRITVLSSSNADALVNFAAGTKHVSVTMTALQGASIRERVTSPRTYYVRTDGSNENTGLADTSGGAFATIGYAINVIVDTLDVQALVTVQVGAGTWTDAIVLDTVTGAGPVEILGDDITPSNCLLSVTGNNCVYAARGVHGYSIIGFKLTTTGWGYGICAADGARLFVGSLDFGACATGHMWSGNGASISAENDYDISGSAPSHIEVVSGGEALLYDYGVTLTGTPAFSTAFWSAASLGRIECSGASFTGTATGKRYEVVSNAVIDTGGEATTFLPGNVAGTTATGGQYV